MCLKALQTSWRRLNTKMSTSSTGKTLRGLVVTSVLSAPWLYHPPLTEVRLVPSCDSSLGIAAQFPGASPAAALGPDRALRSLGTLQPLSLSRFTHQGSVQQSRGCCGSLPGSTAHHQLFASRKTQTLQWTSRVRTSNLRLFLWHWGYSLAFTMGKTWC